jgi:uncharacterized protein (DUF983 family)
MPIPARNPFRKFTCQACGWHRVSYSPGDVILTPGICPKCGGANLKMTSANPVEAAIACPLEYARHLAKKL